MRWMFMVYSSKAGMTTLLIGPVLAWDFALRFTQTEFELHTSISIKVLNSKQCQVELEFTTELKFVNGDDSNDDSNDDDGLVDCIDSDGEN